MAYHHISTNVDKYALFLDNKTEEDALQDNDASTASSFEVILTPQLDLSSLLYLRAVEAELAVTTFMVDSLPLCFIRQESITVKTWMNTKHVEANFVYNKTAVEYQNRIPLQLAMDDFCCAEPQLAINYLNGLLSYSVNHHVLFRYLMCCLDCNIFKSDYMKLLDEDECTLIHMYLNFALVCRQAIHDEFRAVLGIADDDLTPIIEDNIEKLGARKFTLVWETKVLEDSNCLATIKERKIPETGTNLDFSLFYGVSVTKPSNDLTAAQTQVKTKTRNWLVDTGKLETAESPLPKKHVETVKSYLTSNKTLIMQVIQARQILQVQKDRAGIKKSKRTEKNPPTDLFHSNILALSLDPSGLKCQFHLNHSLYLADDDSTIQFHFPTQVSYTLGARNHDINIGPLSAMTAEEGLPRLTTDILYENQRLPSTICTIPKMIFAVADIIAVQSRDMWLQSTPFSDFRIIYSMNLDDQIISDHMISKATIDPVFFKIQRVNSILEKFTIKLLDHNLRQCHFAQRTYARVALVIRPVAIEN